MLRVRDDRPHVVAHVAHAAAEDAHVRRAAEGGQVGLVHRHQAGHVRLHALDQLVKTRRPVSLNGTLIVMRAGSHAWYCGRLLEHLLLGLGRQLDGDVAPADGEDLADALAQVGVGRSFAMMSGFVVTPERTPQA
jgi:hypothetical protein